MKPYNTEQSKTSEVRTMFDRIAPHYDMLNHLLSFGFDRMWRRRAVREIAEHNPQRILDIATGTADLAVDMVHHIDGCHVTGADLSAEMIRYAKSKIEHKGLSSRVELLVADAEQMPFADASFDAVTVAFGVRNFGDAACGLREMQRVLREGGECCILEFSSPRSGTLFAALYKFYFHKVLPLLGGIISRDAQAYKYLPESVDEFPDSATFCGMMREAGFGRVRTIRLMSGVAYIYIGTK